jgi:hypothetical protein
MGTTSSKIINPTDLSHTCRHGYRLVSLYQHRQITRGQGDYKNGSPHSPPATQVPVNKSCHIGLFQIGKSWTLKRPAFFIALVWLTKLPDD